MHYICDQYVVHAYICTLYFVEGCGSKWDPHFLPLYNFPLQQLAKSSALISDQINTLPLLFRYSHRVSRRLLLDTRVFKINCTACCVSFGSGRKMKYCGRHLYSFLYSITLICLFWPVSPGGLEQYNDRLQIEDPLPRLVSICKYYFNRT